MRQGKVFEITLNEHEGNPLKMEVHHIAVHKIEHVIQRTISLTVSESGEEDLEQVMEVYMDSGKCIKINSKKDSRAFMRIYDELDMMVWG